MVPLPEKLETVPPVMVMSEAVKVVEASLKVNVNVAVSPSFKFVLMVLKAMVGTTVSTARASVLLASEPSVLALPAESVKTPLVTLTMPLAVLLAAGVKVAA